MRTRLASLIIVKQEPISHDFNVDGENETINYNNDIANHFYGQNRLENFNGIGDLNNNNSKEEEFEDHKSASSLLAAVRAQQGISNQQTGHSSIESPTKVVKSESLESSMLLLQPQFEDEEECKLFECIPDQWFVNELRNSCFWPPKTGKPYMQRAINCEKPEDHWSICAVRVISGGYLTYYSGFKIVNEKCSQRYNTSSADEQLQAANFRRQHPGLIGESIEHVFSKPPSTSDGNEVIDKSGDGEKAKLSAKKTNRNERSTSNNTEIIDLSGNGGKVKVPSKNTNIIEHPTSTGTVIVDMSGDGGKTSENSTKDRGSSYSTSSCSRSRSSGSIPDSLESHSVIKNKPTSESKMISGDGKKRSERSASNNTNIIDLAGHGGKAEVSSKNTNIIQHPTSKHRDNSYSTSSCSKSRSSESSSDFKRSHPVIKNKPTSGSKAISKNRSPSGSRSRSISRSLYSSSRSSNVKLDSTGSKASSTKMNDTRLNFGARSNQSCSNRSSSFQSSYSSRPRSSHSSSVQSRSSRLRSSRSRSQSQRIRSRSNQSSSRQSHSKTKNSGLRKQSNIEDKRHPLLENSRRIVAKKSSSRMRKVVNTVANPKNKTLARNSNLTSSERSRSRPRYSRHNSYHSRSRSRHRSRSKSNSSYNDLINTVKELTRSVTRNTESVTRNNNLLTQNDRRWNRLEVTINKIFIMVGDMNGNNHINDEPENNSGFNVPDLPIISKTELHIVNRKLKDKKFREFWLNQEKKFCCPTKTSTDTVTITKYLKRFISLKVRCQLTLKETGDTGLTLYGDYHRVYLFVIDVMRAGYESCKEVITVDDAHTALRVVWGRTKQLLKEQNKKK